MNLASYSDAKSLLATDCYRTFLKRLFELKKSQNKGYSWEVFCKGAGFKSRSFPIEVVAGKKRITESSLGKFSRGFGLTGHLDSYFRTLVSVEEVGMQGFGSRADKRHFLEMTKQSILAKYRMNELNCRLGDLFADKHWPCVYACSGTLESGAGVDHISMVSKLPVEVCLNSLRLLEKHGLVEACVDGRWRPKSLHIVFQRLGKNLFFKEYFQWAWSRVLRTANEEFSGEHLFFNSVYTVQEEKFSNFREELKTLLEKYVNSTESASGTQIAHLTVGFIKH